MLVLWHSEHGLMTGKTQVILHLCLSMVQIG